VQASERGPVHGKVHLAKGPISVAPLYLLKPVRCREWVLKFDIADTYISPPS
jgi:hypothetical protein